jgi:hypothetical protein
MGGEVGAMGLFCWYCAPLGGLFINGLKTGGDRLNGIILEFPCIILVFIIGIDIGGEFMIDTGGLLTGPLTGDMLNFGG